MRRHFYWIRTIGLCVLTVPVLECAVSRHRDPFYFETRIENIERPVILAGNDEQCEPVAVKRIIYFPFVFPLNEISKADIDMEKLKDRSLRYKEVIRASDMALTIFGFLIGFVSRTKILSACKSDVIVLTGEEARRYRNGSLSANMQERLEKEGILIKIVDRKNAAPLTGESPEGAGATGAQLPVSGARPRYRIMLTEIMQSNQTGKGYAFFECEIQAIYDDHLVVKTAAETIDLPKKYIRFIEIDPGS